MLNLCLPTGDFTGWQVAGSHIVTELNKLTPIRLWMDRKAVPTAFHQFVPPDYNPRYPKMVDGPLLQAVQGSNLLPLNPNIFSQSKTVGYCFIEDFSTCALYKDNFPMHWDVLVAGSHWCADGILESTDAVTCGVVIQGVDHSVFQPDQFPSHIMGDRQPTPSRSPDEFRIFSGGKFEYRKGQDIVIAAYRHLSAKYPNIHLACSWFNAWPETIESMRASQHISLPNWKPVGSIQEPAYYQEMMDLNGIPNNRYTLLPVMSNVNTAKEYRRCNLGIFPNRAEAGTNLPMMECMACGTPAIATYATGHTDVLGDTVPERRYQIRTGKVIENNWFDADIKAVIDCIERAISNPKTLGDIASLQRQRMKEFTWEKTAKQLLEIVGH